MKYKNLTILFAMMIMTGLGSQAFAQEDDYLNIGGALRYNVVSQHYGGNEFYDLDGVTTDNYATFDTWRLNVSARYSDVTLNFEYRFYPTFNTHFIKQGWLGYDFSEDFGMELGVTQVPFGNLMYNSHSWWFMTGYYVGLEDDFNMGLKFSYDVGDRLNIMAAYFRQQEPAGPSYGSASFGGPAAGTYSYNVIPSGAGELSEAAADIMELNQFNVRLGYEVRPGLEVGVSGQLQGLYNMALDDTEYGHAFAAHADGSFGDWSAKAQFINYDYAAKDNAGNVMDRVQMGAYGDPYYGDGVAARANIISAGIGRGIDVDWGPISNVMPYVDYALMTKDGELEVDGQMFDFEDSHMLVPGFLITAGNIWTYVDFAMGKNHPWLTSQFGSGLGAGHVNEAGQPIPTDDMDWNLRFNINVGYYF